MILSFTKNSSQQNTGCSKINRSLKSTQTKALEELIYIFSTFLGDKSYDLTDGLNKFS